MTLKVYIRKIFGYIRDAHTYSQTQEATAFGLFLTSFSLDDMLLDIPRSQKIAEVVASPKHMSGWFPPTYQVGLIVPIPSSQYRTVGLISFLGHARAWTLRERHDIYEYNISIHFHPKNT